jgi:TRAP-type transport system periplasmic protein
MTLALTRRATILGAASLLASPAIRPARAAAKTKLRFSSAFTETDLRAEAYKGFAKAIGDEFEFEPY